MARLETSGAIVTLVVKDSPLPCDAENPKNVRAPRGDRSCAGGIAWQHYRADVGLSEHHGADQRARPHRQPSSEVPFSCVPFFPQPAQQFWRGLRFDVHLDA